MSLLAVLATCSEMSYSAWALGPGLFPFSSILAKSGSPSPEHPKSASIQTELVRLIFVMSCWQAQPMPLVERSLPSSASLFLPQT